MQIKSTRDARAGKPYDTQLINIDIKYVKTSLGRRVSDSAARASIWWGLARVCSSVPIMLNGRRIEILSIFGLPHPPSHTLSFDRRQHQDGKRILVWTLWTGRLSEHRIAFYIKRLGRPMSHVCFGSIVVARTGLDQFDWLILCRILLPFRMMMVPTFFLSFSCRISVNPNRRGIDLDH